MYALLSSRLSRRPLRIIAPFLILLSFLLVVYQINRVSETPIISHEQISSWLGKEKDTSSSKKKGPFYEWQTRPYFPPLSKGDNAVNYCAGFPTYLLDNIQVVLKTGAGDGKIHASLDTVASCIPELLILSDLDMQLGSRRSIDILADLPPSYSVNNTDFDIYHSQKNDARGGTDVHYSGEGWKLDRYKFLPMVERAYASKPHADWYIFLESDTYFFWDTMFRLLSQLDSSKPHYLGSPVPGSEDRRFAYGGAGFVLSRGVMEPLLRRKSGDDGEYIEPSLSARYEEWVRNDCCGDAVLAYVILAQTGVRLKGLYPIFAGDELKWVRVDRERWCVPLLALHRLSPEEMQGLWKWERTRAYDENPLVHSTLLGHTHSFVTESENNTRTFWDNFSKLDQPQESPSHASAEHCRDACFADAECLQFSWVPRSCKFSTGLLQGHHTDEENGEFISGWDVEKMKKLGWVADNPSQVCKEGTWIRPNPF